jgi:hypothetical protein
MTITSRRLARRCRERFTTEPTALPAPAEPIQAEPLSDVENAVVDAPQENVDATG